MLLFTCALIIAVSVIFAWLGFSTSRRLLNEELTNRGITLVKNLAFSGREAISRENIFKTLNPLMDAVMQEPDVIYVLILNKEGKVIAQKDPDGIIRQAECTLPSEMPRTDTPEVEYHQHGSSVHWHIYKPVYTNPEDETVLADAHDSSTAVNGLVAIGISPDSLHKKLKNLFAATLIIAGVFMVAGIGCAALLSKRITDPLKKLDSAAQKIAKGDYSIQTDIHTGDEIESLAMSFGRMAEEIQTAQHEIEEYSRTLEHKVEERTRELKEAQSQLVQSEKLAGIGQLAAGVAHEINNPTGFIINNLGALETYTQNILKALSEYEDLIREIESDTGKRTEDIEGRFGSIHESNDIEYISKDLPDLVRETAQGAQRIRDIVKNLRDFAHPPDDVIRYTDLNREIESSLSLVWNELKYKCEVTREYGEIAQVPCSPGKIQQVFVNILINASQAIEKEGEIGIRTFSEDSKAVVQIRDNGKGIPEAVRDKIFNPFFTTKAVGKGTGLGLSIVYGIIERLGGTIEVDSEVGKGTEFTLTLPVKGTDDGKPV